MNKVIKIQIIKPINIDWNTFGDILFKIKNETRTIMNKTIQLCWEWHNFSSDYKKELGTFPKEKEILPEGLSLAGFIYSKLKNDHILYSANASQSQQRALKRWKTDSKDIYLGTKSITSYKRDVPLDLHNKSLTVYRDNDGNAFADLKILNKQGCKEFKLTSSSTTVMLHSSDNSTKQILNRVITGEYKIGGSQIVKDKNKWFLNLTFSFETEIKQIDNSNVMGIDMGIVNPLYIAFNNSFARYSIQGGEIDKFRRTVEARRISILQQSKHCGNGRIGHGTQTRIKPIDTLSDKVSNFRDTWNHNKSKYIIDLAVKHNCGIIQMEDLKGVSKENSFLKNWSYNDLQNKIKYKAEQMGITVKFIDPSYTSQRCSKCGHINKENRQDQKTFRCLECGFEVNADYNAARNIAYPDIESIIKNQRTMTTA